MLAAFCERAGEIRLRQVDAPRPAPGEAVVRVAACGICGSDLHWYSGGTPPPAICPGHEIVGEVVEVAGEASVSPGDRVAVEPLRPCRRCARCRRGDYHLCNRLQIIGITEDGGLAETVLAPLEALYKLPEELDFVDCVLAEPLAVAVHAARLAGVGEGTRVAVLGAGAIGILSTVACRAVGAAEIFVTARYPQQVIAARRAGASEVFDSDRQGRQHLRELAAQREIDVVLETVGGKAPTLRQAVQTVAPGGTVVVLGLFHPDPPFPAMTTLVKEVRIIGSMVYNRAGGLSDFERALGILNRERTLVRELVTHRFALPDVDRAFQTASDKSSGSIKVIIEP